MRPKVQSGSSPTGLIRGCLEEYEHKLREAGESHHLDPDEQVLFLEVRPADASEFAGRLQVQGAEVGQHRVLRSVSPAIPNAIAALLLYIRDETGRIPHAYFQSSMVLRFMVGAVSPVDQDPAAEKC